MRDVRARFAALPGVTGVTAANVLPARGGNNWRGVEIEGQPLPKDAEPPNVDARWVEPNYFAVHAPASLQGRGDRGGRRRRRAAGGRGQPLLRRAVLARAGRARQALPHRRPARATPWLTVVGVCGDVIHQWVTRRNYSTMYGPMRQEPRTRLAFALRTTGDPDALGPAVRRALMEVDPDQPADDILSMRRAIPRGTIGMQYVAGIMSAFGVLALVLAVSGVYGVLSYRVSLRTAEIGVRMALGATRRHVLSLTLGQALRLAAIGLGVGVVLAVGTGRLLSSALRGAVASDPALLAGVTVALALAALPRPGSRAPRDGRRPATALRAE